MSDMSQNIETEKTQLTVKSNIVSEPKEFTLRFLGNLLILVFIFLLAFVTLLLNTDIVEKKMQELSQDMYDFASDLGLTLDDVLIVGRDKTSSKDILKTLRVKRGDNFLKINIHDLKNRIESLPWVKSAIIKRKFFPNVLEIILTERNVRSIWQINEQFHPIDDDGHVIDAPFHSDKPILLIVGEGAPQNINKLLAAISSNKKILERVKVANYISNRRWNLVLDDIENGITIKLPEENIETAWKKLLKLDATNGILKRKLTIIDLRLEGKVTVKLKKSDGKAPLMLNSAKERHV